MDFAISAVNVPIFGVLRWNYSFFDFSEQKSVQEKFGFKSLNYKLLSHKMVVFKLKSLRYFGATDPVIVKNRLIPDFIALIITRGRFWKNRDGKLMSEIGQSAFAKK